MFSHTHNTPRTQHSTTHTDARDATDARRSLSSLWWKASASAGALLALTGCWEKTPRSILEPVSEQGALSKYFWDLLIAVNSVILAIVGGVFLIAIFKFRRKPGDDELPEQVHGNIKMELGWTIIPAIIVVALMVPTLKGIFKLEEWPPVNEKTGKQELPAKFIEVQVTGKQWWWEFDYGEDNGAPEFSTANEMHVEVGTWVKLNVTSADVIHAFWVPRVMGKRDATPGRAYPMYFKIDKPGEYIGQCAELCGESHALMGIKIFAHPKEGENSYDNWVEAQKASAVEPTSALAIKGKKLFVEKACVRCHMIRGHKESTLTPMGRMRWTGPDLTHVGSRTTIAGLALPNTRENLVRWIHAPAEIKGGALMADKKLNGVDISVEEAEALAAYLYKLK